MKLEAYRSLVHPVLEDASIVWEPYFLKDIAEVERIQRLAARFILSDYRTSTSVTNLLKQLELEPLHLRRQISRLKFLYLLYNNSSGLSSDTYLPPVPQRSARLNHSKVICPYYARTNLFQNSFFPNTIEHGTVCVIACGTY